MRALHHPIIAIVGLGEWGETLIHVACRMGIPLHGFDRRLLQAKQIKRRYPLIHVHTSLAGILDDNNIAAVILATPPSTHYALARTVLRAGKHVLIEKPMTQNVIHARVLLQSAASAHRIIMVDHTYVFSPSLHVARRLIRSGLIGNLKRIDSVRLGGHAFKDSTVLWDLAPHDIAISRFLLGTYPSYVQTIGKPYTQKAILDEANIELLFTAPVVRYRSRLSWNAPTKSRILTCVGDKGVLHLSWDRMNEQLLHRTKNRKMPINTPHKEPLAEMLTHFISCITTNRQPVSSGQSGYDVVRMVTALHESWKRNGAIIPI